MNVFHFFVFILRESVDTMKHFVRVMYVIRELKQTTTTTATRTSLKKVLMSKTIAVHVRYKSLYISLPSSAKRQLEMTKFRAVYGTWTTTANFSFFHLEMNAVVCIFSLSTFLEPLVNRTDVDNREFRL